jgi:chromosome partitioning protein
MKVITFLNGKGGVGKTTLCANVAHGLLVKVVDLSKAKLIMVDADPQGSLTDWHNVDNSNALQLSIERYETLVAAPKRQALYSAHRLAEQTDKNYVLIDTAGRTHETAGAALSLSDLVIIPLQPSPLDVWATIDSIDLVQCVMRGNKNLRALFVINQATVHSTVNEEVFTALKEAAPNIPVSPTIVHGRVAFARAINDGNTIFHTKDRKGMEEILSLTDEILALLGAQNDNETQ